MSSERNIAAPCLHCGYDLRSAIRPGFGEVRCPECGETSPLRELRLYGLRASALVMLITIALVPAAVLMISGKLLSMWSGNNLHAVLCLVFAPFVIGAHIYGIREFIRTAITLTRQCKSRVTIVAIVAAALIDIGACALIVAWLR